MLSCEICEISKSTCFEEYLQATASVISLSGVFRTNVSPFLPFYNMEIENLNYNLNMRQQNIFDISILRKLEKASSFTNVTAI